MNFKHLHYFWVVAKQGGILRAGELLHTTPQTLSGQIKLLEERLGKKLFRKRGRNLELTETGKLALGYAEEIFTLGAELEHAIRNDEAPDRVVEFRIGIDDAVPKSVAYHLIEPALHIPEQVKLVCREWKLDNLIAELALHRLDIVIANTPIPPTVSIKAFNHKLGRSGVSFFGTPALIKRYKGDFPACLQGAPMLVFGDNSAMQPQLERWLSKHGIRVRIVGEFDDGALMKAFGREGQGFFIGASVLEDEIQTQYGVKVIGRSDELVEEFYAISVERRLTHPCVLAITEAARTQLFAQA